MKLHDNSRLGRVGVIGRTARNLLKTKELIETLRGLIGGSHFKVNGTGEEYVSGRNQVACDSPAAKFGSYRNVENLHFTRGNCATDQESCNCAVANCNDAMIGEIFCRIPLRRFGGRLLDSGDGRQIAGEEPANGEVHLELGRVVAAAGVDHEVLAALHAEVEVVE